MKAQAAIATGSDWHSALEEAASQIPMLNDGTAIDLTLLFASDDYGPQLPDLVSAVRAKTGGGMLIGCTGQGIIGPAREVEGEPALSLQVFSLPGATLTPGRLTADDVNGGMLARIWVDKLGGLKPDEVNAWLFFVDPFTLDGDRVLELLSTVNKGVPLVGGLASGDYERRTTSVFLNDDVFGDGAVGVAIGGEYTVRTIVSQGAAPIGETWTITEAEGNVIQTIGMRPALEVLTETFHALPVATQERARRNLLVGLAMDEYKDEFTRGDFLIRNLVGVDQDSGAIAIGAYPRVGQTLQFQIRDPAAADEDLKELLIRAAWDLGDQQPVGALLCACNGRGIGLFGEPDHDAKALNDRFGALPVAGFFCNGEIGPVGNRNFLHGFTASIALILPKQA